MGCAASTQGGVAELQRRHEEQVKELEGLLEAERAKAGQAGGTADGRGHETAGPMEAPKIPGDAATNPLPKATPQAGKEGGGRREAPAEAAPVREGNVHVTVADLVRKFVEDAGVNSRLSSAILGMLPPEAAAGDLEAAQLALRGMSAEKFWEVASAAQGATAEALACKASEMSERHRDARSAQEINAKYAMEDGSMIEGAFGDVSDFLKGVEGIGLPQPEPLKGMAMEFTHGADARSVFTTSNFNTETTPAAEWDFVTRPFSGESVAARPEGPRSAWSPTWEFSGNRNPIRLRVFLYAVTATGANGRPYADLAAARRLDPADDLHLAAEEADLVRVAVLRFAKSQLDGRSLGLVKGAQAGDAEVSEVRARLKAALSADDALGYGGVAAAVRSVLSEEQLEGMVAHFRERLAHAGLTEMEVVAMRLYTGPPFLKVNSVLRAWSGKFPESMTAHLQGNRYINTIHVAVSGLTKLQKVCVIPMGRKSYRGMAGVLLPRVFWEADELRAKGGVDFGFMSTTTEKEVAISYIPTNKQMPIIFEIELGCIDRGSSLSFLSQYPDEDEILFPPLSYLETTGQPYMEVTKKGDVLVLPARVSCNLKGKTVEEIASRRKEEHLNMREYLGKELRRDLDIMREVLVRKGLLGAGDGTADLFDHKRGELEAAYEAQLREYRGRDPGWFNRDDNYKKCIARSIDFKAQCITALLSKCGEQVTMHRLAQGEVGCLSPQQRQGLGLDPGDGPARAPELAAELLDALLQLGADPEAKEESDQLETLLHTACDKGNLLAVRTLLRYGAEVEALDQGYKQTPLLFAAASDNVEVVEELLRAGASIDAVDEDKYNAFHKAASNGDEAGSAILELLMERALEVGGVTKVALFLESKDSSGWTPLIHACSSENLGAAKMLLDEFADIGLCDGDGRSPLHHAAEGRDAEAIVQLLLDKKADPKMKDGNGNTALHACAESGGIKVLRLLLDLDPTRIDEKGADGQTPLHFCAQNDQQMVQLLLERGADEKIADMDKKLASKLAKENDNHSIAKLLKAKERGEDWTLLKKKEGDSSSESPGDSDNESAAGEEEEQQDDTSREGDDFAVPDDPAEGKDDWDDGDDW